MRVRRVLVWSGRIALVLALLPVVLVGLALVALNVPQVQRLVASQVGPLTGGMVSLSGLSGTIPTAPRIARLEIRDANGPWLVVEDAALDWSPLALLHGTAHVDRLAARSVEVARLPVSGSSPTPTSPSSSGTFQLPVQVQADAIAIGAIRIGAPVVGTPMAFSADGHAHLDTLTAGNADLTLHALGIGGTYHVRGTLADNRVQAQIEASEPAGGLASQIAKQPQVDPLDLSVSVDGPWEAIGTHMTLAAGPLHASASGTIDKTHGAAQLDLAANAPAMTPVPGVSFGGLDLRAHVSGPFAAPDAKATLTVDDLAASGAAVHHLTADISGNRGAVTVIATAAGTRVPGPRPDLLEADPLVLRAHARLDQPSRPVTFALTHPLLRVTGQGETAGTIRVAAHVEAPDLAPLAAIGGVDLQGRTALDLAATLPPGGADVTLDGTVGVTGGMAPAPALIGPGARIGVTASMRGQDITLSRLTVAGKAFSLEAKAGLTKNRVSASADLGVSDLQAAAPTLNGAASVHVTAGGPLDDLAIQADLSGDVGTKGVPKGHVAARVAASGLPNRLAGHVEASGNLDGAPLSLLADAKRSTDGALALTIDKADWKSAHAHGAFALAQGAALPLGHLDFSMRRLDDLRRVTGQALTGSVAATVDVAQHGGPPQASAHVTADNAGLPGTASVRRLVLDARVDNPTGDMQVDASLAADGAQASGVAGKARLSVRGPRSALGIALDASANGAATGAATVATRATLDLAQHSVAVASFAATAKGATARLLAPAKVSFGDTVAVDRLRLGVRQAVLDVAGRISPTLDLTASLRNVTADLARIAVPTLQADGSLSADARLTGTTARPSGTVHLAANGLHMRQGAGAGLPPASITADARLAGTSATVNARLAAGRNALTVTGTAPIDPAGAMNLRAAGTLDLALTDPILTPSGERARGTITLDATTTGTLAAPRASGSLHLAGGAFEDYGEGARVHDIDALINAAGDHIDIAHLTGKAGNGTIALNGTVALAPPMPLDLHVVMQRATPVASDLLTAVLDADLRLRGQAAGRMDASGRVTIDRADINVAAKLPSSVAVLDVRRPGQKPPPPPVPPPDIGLDVAIHSPGRIFIRGRGLDAEMAGDLHLGGTLASLRPSGGFEMRRGSFSIAGQNLTFTTGKVSFDGSRDIDPSLDFVASSTSGNGSFTANLNVGGYASDPKITLTSTPQAPQDEILARLLFGQSAASLGPFQLAAIAAALADLASGGGGGLDPLGSIRQGLGLDRLSVGSSTAGQGASLEAGKYVAPGVYVGAKQGTSGGGTQAMVQVDLLKGLKLETDVGTGGTSATGSSSSQSSNGTNVGLTYQFQY